MKINDKVRIKKTSNYYGQSYSIGIIVKITKEESHPYSVQFERGYHNAYRKEDLEIVTTNTQKIKEKLGV